MSSQKYYDYIANLTFFESKIIKFWQEMKQENAQTIAKKSGFDFKNQNRITIK
jgi:hypothetical protein